MTQPATETRSRLPAAPLDRLPPEMQEELSRILEQYLADVERGRQVDPRELVAQHPQLEEPLHFYLEGLELLRKATADVNAPESAPLPYRELGDFRILRELGRGGMGVVYEAEQRSMRRTVALKVLPFAAVLDQKQVIRFNNEAQAAGQLNHPNIVPVYSVGCERGVHYYSMQLIDGLPLDRAIHELRVSAGMATADETAGIPPTTVAASAETPAHSQPPARDDRGDDSIRSSVPDVGTRGHVRTVVEMGIQAAEGLHHAHECGVVHRDIKPSNLIIDRSGKLWITDFGLARCPTNTNVTMTGDLLGTAGYMSPEQAAGRTNLVDERTDIYSLGITLYELLTLRQAVTGADRQELMRNIEQRDPRPVRRLNPSIPIDLETIIGKAIAKDREDRYDSAAELADDLRRFLEGKPTLARRPTAIDRAAKWVSRHRRFALLTLAAMFVALLGTTAAVMLIAREEQKTAEARDIARNNFRETRAVLRQFGNVLATQLADIPGTEKLRRDLLQVTLEYYEGFVEASEEDVDLKFDLAFSQSMIGEIRTQLGDIDEAIGSYEAAIGAYQELCDHSPAEPRYRHDLALCINNLGHLYQQSGQTAAARESYQRASALQRACLAGDAQDPTYQSALASTLMNYASLQRKSGQSEQAVQIYRESLAIQQALVAAHPESREYAVHFAGSHNELSFLLGNDLAAATTHNSQAIEILTGLVDQDERDWRSRAQLAACYNNRGSILLHNGQSQQARQAFEEAIEIQADLARRAPNLLQLQNELGVSYNNLGQLIAADSPEQARERFLMAVDIFTKLTAASPRTPSFVAGLGGVMNNLALVEERLGRKKEALEAYEAAIQHQRAALGSSPEMIEYREFLSTSYVNYGRILQEQRRTEEAVVIALERRELWQGDPDHLFGVARELATLASSVRAAGELTDQDHQQGWIDEILRTLEAAVHAGFDDFALLADDHCFQLLKDEPRFHAVVNRVAPPKESQPIM